MKSGIKLALSIALVICTFCFYTKEGKSRLDIGQISLSQSVGLLSFDEFADAIMPTIDSCYIPMVAEPLYGKEKYIFYISQIHEQYYPNVDPYIAMAVMEIESNYQPDVKSSVGAVGLMQILPKYHANRALKYGLNDIWDPYTNIIIGMDLLNELYEGKQDWSKALLGYNNDTKYVNLVLAKANELKGGGYFG